MPYPREILESVLSQYDLSSAKVEPLTVGLINKSFLVTGPDDKFLLQRVNEMFAPESHADIDMVTRHLLSIGMESPRLIHTNQDELFYEDEIGVWRLYTYIEGNSMDIVERPEAAYQAGALLGRFHVALADLDYEFINPRDPVHHLDRHIQHLQASLEHQQHHVNYAQVEALAMDILQQAELLPRLPEMNIRKVHGDPKINNFLFNSQTGDAICMVDFDTLSTMPVALELGDAMRSWCNPGGENIQAGHFAMDLFESGLRGYISTTRGFIERIELAAVLPATRIIYVELAARFCADALNEDYFAWDPDHFKSHSEHSLVRSTCQFNCYKSLSENLHLAEEILAGLLP